MAASSFNIMSKSSIIYIDGFNLYYGALKGTAYKWLDLASYFQRLRTDDNIRRIWYFTALIPGSKGGRQQAYLDALRTTPIVGLQHGLYKNKTVTCRVPTCRYGGPKEFLTPEEKRTDVNIAVQMLDDAYQAHCERMVLVSGDSDIVPTIERIKQRFPHIQITVYVPAQNRVRGAAVELRNAADKHKTLPLRLLSLCQFPPEMTTTKGIIHKPANW